MVYSILFLVLMAWAGWNAGAKTKQFRKRTMRKKSNFISYTSPTGKKRKFKKDGFKPNIKDIQT